MRITCQIVQKNCIFPYWNISSQRMRNFDFYSMKSGSDKTGRVVVVFCQVSLQEINVSDTIIRTCFMQRNYVAYFVSLRSSTVFR